MSKAAVNRDSIKNIIQNFATFLEKSCVIVSFFLKKYAYL